MSRYPEQNNRSYFNVLFQSLAVFTNEAGVNDYCQPNNKVLNSTYFTTDVNNSTLLPHSFHSNISSPLIAAIAFCTKTIHKRTHAVFATRIC